MSSDPKNYFGFLVDEISELGLTIKLLFLTIRIIRRKLDSKYSFNEFRLKVFDVSLEMSGDPKNYFGFI